MENLKGKITSVFPSTTASAITTFFTGFPPQQHAVTGWFMLLKELGVVSRPLRFDPRCGGLSFSENGIKIEQILNVNPFSKKLKVKCYTINHSRITNTDYSKMVGGKSKSSGYSNITTFFKEIKKTILSNKKRKFIYAYWPKLDEICHEFGAFSPNSHTHFKEIDRRLELLIKSLEGTNTTIIITADHGFIDSKKSDLIRLEDHPKLAETLTLPLCGEPRLAFCYVRPSKTEQFESYAKRNLSGKVWMFKSEELIKKNFFGLYTPNKKLGERVGDYVLIPKKTYLIKDFLPNEKKGFQKGNHGGVSSEEMFVPLIVAKC